MSVYLLIAICVVGVLVFVLIVIAMVKKDIRIFEIILKWIKIRMEKWVKDKEKDKKKMKKKVKKKVKGKVKGKGKGRGKDKGKK